MSTATAYNASSIQVLEGLDPVRKRPGMYIGGTGSAGLHHLVWEIFDNSVDEAMNGHATQIEVTLRKDGESITVSDNGQGIPVGTHPQHKKPAVFPRFPRLVFMYTSSSKAVQYHHGHLYRDVQRR